MSAAHRADGSRTQPSAIESATAPFTRCAVRRCCVCQGHRLLFVTNNSGKSRVAYESKMRSMGFGRALQADSVLSSSSAAAHYIAQQPLHVFDRSTHAVYFIGDTGIAEELQLRGIRAVSARELLGSAPVARSKLSSQPLDPSIAAVVVGIDDQLTYAKIAYAAALLSEPMAGGQQRLFVATNRDSTLPTAGRDLPGAGVCVAAVETASGRAAVNVGKPEPLMFQLASDELHLAPPEHCLMIGDRLDTDIAFGQRAGMHTMLVETGISKRADAMRADNSAHPTYIVADVSQLLAGTHSPHEQQQ